MAQIPIFDGAQGGGQEATIRPTRIGPEEPRSTVGEAISGGMKELTAVARQMSYLKDGNDLNAGNLALTNHMNSVKQQLESQPLSQFTTPQAYVAQAKQLSDPTKLLQSFSGYSPRVQKMLAANAQRFQDDFLNQQTNNSIVLGHHKLLSDTNTNLAGYASAYGQADPTHAALYRKLGTDSIQHAVDLGAMTPQEGAARSKQFLNQLDVSALGNLIHENPAMAGQILTNNDTWNRQFPSLTPAQRFTAINQVHTILTRQMNSSNDELKAQTSQAEAEFMNRWHSGTLTPGWADEQVQHFPSLRNYYTAAFGKKPPSEGNDAAYGALISQLNDPYLKLEDVDKIKEQAAGAGLNQEQSKAFGIAAASRARNMNSALSLSRKDAQNQWDSQLNNYRIGLPAGAASLYDHSHGFFSHNPGAKGPFESLIDQQRKQFQARLAAAGSEQEIQDLWRTYGNVRDHLPADPGELNPKSGVTLPPVGTLSPADASKKYSTLGKIKIPGA